MPRPQDTPIPVSWKQVTAFRLARQHLLERAPSKKLVQVVGDMAGAQAQLLSAAQASLWARLQGLRLAQVEAALDRRKLARAACMRRTLFLLPSQQLAVFVRGTARRAEKEIRWALGKGLPAPAVERAIEAALTVLDEPLTRPEIAERVSRALGVPSRDYQGGGWGNRRKLAGVPIGHLTYPVVELLHLVAARGVVCYGPYHGNEPTFVRADAWIPNWHDLSREEAERMLLHSYLRAYAPATAMDFAVWSGMTLTEARALWAGEQAGFAAVDVEGWQAEVLRKDVDPLLQAKLERPHVRLLPYFDSFLLGHRERKHLVAREHHPKVYRAQGWISPVVLVDGRVAGVWESVREKDRLTLKLTSFEPLSRRVSARIEAEAQDLGRFLEAASVQVVT